ncbi:MAG TPA: crosslink repair DNA glycosylase YcaQ family protein [Anaerolineales bacterium]|nr:crosslink repair DNA glycosylase YcaQ family protein [Anaerolineales bacterium]
MPILQAKTLLDYRAHTFRTLPGQRLTRREQAVKFVDERGFIYFWPIKDILLPSLWVAVAGDRPVADQHDDPGHVTWGWKDALLGSQEWYYAKVLRKKATMISMQAAPYFYALSENYGSPEEDYLTIYEQGRLTQEAKAVYEAVLDKGPLDTIALRREARLSSRESEARFNKALADLQADFKLVPVAVAQAGAWRYAFVYDIVARHYPEIPEAARQVSERSAHKELIKHHVTSLGAVQIRDIVRLFRWKTPQVERAVSELVQSGFIQPGVELENQTGEWLVLPQLL